jgi:hypothetical protein
MDPPVHVYIGFDELYPTIRDFQDAYSNIQLQTTTKSSALISGFTSCTGYHKLNDVPSSVDKFLPVDAFATDPDWRLKFNLTQVADLPIRPCGAKFFWVPTDTVTLFDFNSREIQLDTSSLSSDLLDIPPEPANQTLPYIDSVTGEFVWADASTQRMRAWMRNNAHPKFTIKVGQINSYIENNEKIQINISNCRNLYTTKFLKFCSVSALGDPNDFITYLYFAWGGFIILLGMIYASKRASKQHQV